MTLLTSGSRNAWQCLLLHPQDEFMLRAMAAGAAKASN